MGRHLSQRQKGMTFISIAFLLALIVIATLLTLKIAPIYLEYYDVYKSLDTLKGQDLAGKTPRQIRDLLRKKLDMNMVDSVSGDDISIAKQGRYVKVEVDYEVIEHLVGNMDILVYFNKVIEVDEN